MFSTSRWLVGSSRIEEIGARERHERERHASPLAAAERADLAKHFIAAEAERAEAILHLASAPERPLILDRIEQRLAEREVGEVLPKPCGRDRSADLRLATRRFAIADDGGDERRLARAVRPDERDEVVPSQHGREVLDEHAAGHFHAQVLDRDHLIAAAFSDFELERTSPPDRPAEARDAAGARVACACPSPETS